MGIARGRHLTRYLCDVCSASCIEPNGNTWDEGRMTAARVKATGWSFKKKNGSRWEVFCPSCSAAQHYSLAPEYEEDIHDFAKMRLRDDD